MHIAIYYPWIYLTSGVERVILEICKRSKHQYTVFTNHFDLANTYPEFQELNVVELPFVPVNRDLWPVLKASMTIAFQKVELKSFDVLMVHCDGIGDLILNRLPKIPAVCFCHTPLRPVFDHHYRARVVERFRAARRLTFYLFSEGFKVVDRRMWLRYRYVFFNSNVTRMRAERGGLLRGKDGKYEVLHPGIDSDAQQPSWRYEPYFLLPGRIMWTKNVELAIQAFILFKKSPELEHFRLVIAGRVDAKSQSYLEKLRKMTTYRDDVEFVISPTDNMLWSLYANCYSVLFPSFNEDWGMVPLEANTYGKPVIATNLGGPRESQVDGKTGFLVSLEPGAFAQAMARLVADEKLVRIMGHAARENARQYDWSHFVDRIDLVLEKLVGSVR